MSKYKKRFSEKEYADELLEHIKAKPSDLPEDRLEKHARDKAKHYAKALENLDHAVKRLKKIYETQKDPEIKKEIEFSIKTIDESIGEFGEASMVYNNEYHTWSED